MNRTGAKALPPHTSARKAELIALMRALQLGKDKKLNMFVRFYRHTGYLLSVREICTLINE